MASMERRRSGVPASPFARLDRMFDEWFRTLPMRRPLVDMGDDDGDDVIRVEEFRDGNTQVIRAELPGIDPDKDVDLTVRDGMLRIAAQRRVEQETQEKGYTRRELRYGTFSRTLPLPEGAAEKDINASYKDGILEIRVPVAEPPASDEPTKISISRG
jgi:HSP20 family protein